MDARDIQQQLHLLQKQAEATTFLNTETQLNLLAAIDCVRVEVEVLKRFMERSRPDFGRQYAALWEEVIQAVDPQ